MKGERGRNCAFNGEWGSMVTINSGYDWRGESEGMGIVMILNLYISVLRLRREYFIMKLILF